MLSGPRSEGHTSITNSTVGKIVKTVKKIVENSAR